MLEQTSLNQADITFLEKRFGAEKMSRFYEVDLNATEMPDADMDKILSVVVAMESASDNPYWQDSNPRVSSYYELCRHFPGSTKAWILSWNEFKAGIELLLERKVEDWELNFKEYYHLLDLASCAFNKLKQETTSVVN